MWFKRYLQLTRYDLPPILLNAGSLSAVTLLTELQFAELTPIHWLLGAAVVGAGTFLATEPLVRGNIAQRAEERSKRRKLAQSLIHDISEVAVREISACPDNTGVIVFLPEHDGLLHAAFTYHKDERPDRALVFRPLQGCTGHAWDTGRQTVAKLEEVNEDELRLTWKLTAEQIAVTRHLRMVVSTPIWDWDHPDTMVGSFPSIQKLRMPIVTLRQRSRWTRLSGLLRCFRGCFGWLIWLRPGNIAHVERR